MKKLKISCVVLLFLCVLFLPNKIHALNDKVNVYMFYGETCPHCEEEYEYLNSIKEKYNINIYRYEVWYNEENKKLLNEISDFLDTNVTGVPYTVVNNKAISGYLKSTTPDTLIYNINQAKRSDFVDEVGIKLGIIKDRQKDKDNSDDEKQNNIKVNIPIIGEFSLNNMSFPLMAMLMGLIDGFNPFILVLFILINILIAKDDKKRLLVIGLTFILTSLLTYLSLMFSWVEYEKLIDFITWIRLIVSLSIIILGIVSLKRYDELLDRNDEKRFVKKNNNVILVILGIVLLSMMINILEFTYSTKLSISFTQMLSANNIDLVKYCAYLLIYILFFMVYYLIILVVMIKETRLFSKYPKGIYAIVTIIIISIGILLLSKPEWVLII